MVPHIKSFVRREGRMTHGQQQALQKLWPCYGLEVSAGLIDQQAIFGRLAPLTLEIGFGMGQSLLALAAANPNQDYVGIEVYRPGVGALLAGLAKQQLTNVRVYCTDAILVLQQCIADNSLEQLLLLFPDPWPKKRHHKRRLVQPDFIKLAYAKLKPAGILHMATDWENYAQHMQQVMSKITEFQTCDPKTRPNTKFEQRGKNLGHKIWDLVFRKI